MPQSLEDTSRVVERLTPTTSYSMMRRCRSKGEKIAMTGGLLASVVTSHSPRMGVEASAPEFIRGLIDGLDRKFIELTTEGRVAELTAWMPEFVREGVAEMGGRTISSMVGGIEALAEDHGELVGTHYGPYAQSSGSGNAHVAVFPAPT